MIFAGLEQDQACIECDGRARARPRIVKRGSAVGRKVFFRRRCRCAENPVKDLKALNRRHTLLHVLPLALNAWARCTQVRPAHPRSVFRIRKTELSHSPIDHKTKRGGRKRPSR
jgi:hypothetical protein